MKLRKWSVPRDTTIFNYNFLPIKEDFILQIKKYEKYRTKNYRKNPWKYALEEFWEKGGYSDLIGVKET